MPALGLAKDLIARLPFEDQEELHAFLTRLVTPAMIEGAAEPARARKPRRGVHVATLRSKEGTFTHRNEFVRCGKPTCACAKGKLHGPYAYKYWRDAKTGKLRKAYVGKVGAQPARRDGEGKPRA